MNKGLAFISRNRAGIRIFSGIVFAIVLPLALALGTNAAPLTIEEEYLQGLDGTQEEDQQQYTDGVEIMNPDFCQHFPCIQQCRWKNNPSCDPDASTDT